MVNFRKITEENFDAIINRKRPEGVAPNAVSPARAWPYRNQKRAWKAADFPGVSLCNVQSTVNKPLNCNLKRRALHPHACSAGLSSLHSWAPLGSFLHAINGWEIIFTAQKRYRAPPRSPGFHTSPVRHCPRALPANLLHVY